jgi:hypothetical protein
MGIQRERRQVKGIGNIFDKIIAENCKNLETEMRLLDNTRKEDPNVILLLKHWAYRTRKDY